MRRVLVPTAYVILGVAALALVVLNVLAWTGSLVDDPPPPSSRPDPEPAAGTRPPPAPEPQPVSGRPTTPPGAPETNSLTISATRGDCWVEVRAGSTTGKVLYAGMLAAGKTIRFNRKKLWLRLGAASNVDIVLNGRQSTVPPGTVELLLPT